MRFVTIRDTAAQADAEARDQAVRAVAWAIARSTASTRSYPTAPPHSSDVLYDSGHSGTPTRVAK
jgi:hypothetical protein